MGIGNSIVPEKVYVQDISPNNLSEEIQNGLQFVEFRKIVDADSTVFIKRPTEFSITTMPLMIQTVIEVLSPLVKRLLVVNLMDGTMPFSRYLVENHGV